MLRAELVDAGAIGLAIRTLQLCVLEMLASPTSL
jgi:hypothetical protein